jgi:hypothetical protein
MAEVVYQGLVPYHRNRTVAYDQERIEMAPFSPYNTDEEEDEKMHEIGEPLDMIAERACDLTRHSIV